MISQFWLAEAVVTARSTLTAEDAGRVESRLNQLAAMPAPKLLIFCPTADRLRGAALDWGEFKAHLRRQDEFPWIEISVTTEDRITDQIAAAFASMQ